MIPGKHDFLGSKGHCAEKQDEIEDKESESEVSSKKPNRKHLQVWCKYMHMLKYVHVYLQIID